MGSGLGRGDGRHSMGASEVRVREKSAVFRAECQCDGPNYAVHEPSERLETVTVEPTPTHHTHRALPLGLGLDLLPLLEAAIARERFAGA